MSAECPVCRSEGWEAQARILVSLREKHVVATLNVLTGGLLARDEASLSEVAWRSLEASDGDLASVSSLPPLSSMSHVRAKVYGRELDAHAVATVVQDIVAGRYSGIELSAFVTACAAHGLDRGETVELTRAMIAVGERMHWDSYPVVDKHSVGGLPGNRTTPIVCLFSDELATKPSLQKVG